MRVAPDNVAYADSENRKLIVEFAIPGAPADTTYEHGLLRIEVPFKDPMEDAVKVVIRAGGVEAKAKKIEGR